jgi:hypothetical protein
MDGADNLPLNELRTARTKHMKILLTIVTLVTSCVALATGPFNISGEAAEQILADGKILSANYADNRQQFVVEYDDKIYGCEVNINRTFNWVTATCGRVATSD